MPHLRNYIIHKIKLIVGDNYDEQVIEQVDIFIAEYKDCVFGNYSLRSKHNEAVQDISFSKEEFRQYKLDQLIDSN